MASIGETLKEAREALGLSLEDVWETTRITVQNLSALEEDRFDRFPNRVYARAFLRDYANFLNLDSGSLLARYEAEWQREAEAAPARAERPRSLVRRLGYSLIGLILIGGLAAGAYYSWETYGRHRAAPISTTRPSVDETTGEVAQLPRAKVPLERAENAVSERARQPKLEPKKPAVPAKPVVPDKLVLEVTTLRHVWVELKTDGITAVYAILPPGTRTFEAKKKIYIKVGQANGVRLKKNGQPLPPLGTRAVKAERVFILEQPPAPKPPPAPTSSSVPVGLPAPAPTEVNR